MTYDVNDSAGNAADQVTRTVTVNAVPDTTKPVITLKGSATVALNVGDTYTDAGATATDDVDGNITNKIVVNNPVNTGVAGTYTVTYDVNDSAGNAADQVTRTVRVNHPPVADAGADQAGYKGDTIDLDGSASFDPDGTIASYVWKEGATTLSTNDSFSKSDFASGEHNITLTVTDDDGATASDAVLVTIYQKLKKTGQTKIYDAAGTEHNRTEADNNASLRDDGYYQTGVIPSYTRDNAKEIVTDTITGLQWQDNDEANATTRPWLTQGSFDKCTGANGETQDTSKCNDTNGTTAATYCSELTLDGGGWRLPTRAELVSLSDYGRVNPAMSPTFTNVNVASGEYWSSTTYAGSGGSAWRVNFSSGDQYSSGKRNTHYVRCVRTGQ